MEKANSNVSSVVGCSANGFQKVATRVDLIQEALLLPADLAVTTPDLKEEMPDMDLEALAHQTVLAHLAVQDHLEATTLDMAHQLEFQPDTAQLSIPNQLQLAALATKDHQDHLAPKGHQETQERTAITEKMERMARTPNCWLPNLLKFVLSAHQAHKDLPDLPEPKGPLVQKDPPENLPAMVFQENKEWPELKDNQVVQDEKDHVELQANPDVSSLFQALKAQLVHQDRLENRARKANQVPTDNHSKAHQDCPEMPAKLAAKAAQDLKVHLDQPEKKAKRVRANTARLHALHPVIKPPIPKPFAFPLDFQWPLNLLIFVCLYCPTKMFAFPASQSLNPISR